MACDNSRFHNMETYHSCIGCVGGSPGGWDHMANNLALGPQPSLTAPNKVGRRHNHLAPGGRDHIVFSGNQATWRTSTEMYLEAPDAQSTKPPWGDEQHQPSAASGILLQPQRQSLNWANPDHTEQHIRSANIPDNEPKPTDPRIPGAVDTESSVPAEIIGRRPEEALQLLRAALAGRGAHGALEFAQQLRLASTMTSSGHKIGFTDIARVVARFCTMADAYIHAIFRALDKDCHGCVSVAEIVDSVFVRLPIKQMNQVKIVFAAIHQALAGDMDIRTVLQLEQFKNHVDHLSGRKSKASLIGEFADCIASDMLTWQKFLTYYRAVATSTMANDTAFSQSVKDTWRIQYPGDEAAAASRAESLTEPTPVYALPHGSLRRFPQALHVGASPVFNPTTYSAPEARRQGKATLGWLGTHSTVRLG